MSDRMVRRRRVATVLAVVSVAACIAGFAWAAATQQWPVCVVAVLALGSVALNFSTLRRSWRTTK